MSISGETPSSPEKLLSEEAVDFLEARIAAWDFKAEDVTDSTRFLTTAAHWALETFGSERNDGIQYMYPKESYPDGFDHVELPADLKPIVMSDHYAEMYVGDHNRIFMHSTFTQIEEDPFIPKYDEISKLDTFVEQIAAMRADPEILRGMQQSRFGIIPGIDIQFEPAHFFNWGLLFRIQHDSVRVFPHGKAGSTEIPFQYAVDRANNPKLILATAAELVVLACKHTNKWRDLDITAIDSLVARLEGRESIPLDKLRLREKPGNSVMNMLICEALKTDEET